MIIETIKKILGKKTVEKNTVESKNVDWIDEKIVELENHRLNNESIAFKIVKSNDKGFLTKVKGLYAFIYYTHMPWKYNDRTFWYSIAPLLIGKRFYCKIHKIDRKPLAIILDGEIPQFKKVELIEGEEYTGFVLNKASYGIFIDLGIHFNWECGSLLGLLHSSQLGRGVRLDDFKNGQKISIIFSGLNENGQLVLNNDRESIDWEDGIPQGLVGQELWATVVRTSGKKNLELFVNGRYKAVLNNRNEFYSQKYLKVMKNAKNALRNKEMIKCKVIGYKEKQRTLKVKWLLEIDKDFLIENTIKNNLDQATINRLNSLKREDMLIE